MPAELDEMPPEMGAEIRKELKIPEMVVFGQQSAGKSTVLELLARKVRMTRQDTQHCYTHPAPFCFEMVSEIIFYL